MDRSQMSLYAVALTLFLLFVQSAHANRDVATPMCTEVRGFAGEFNDRIRLPIEGSPGPKEAIVLIARAFPADLKFLTQFWLQMNATLTLAQGPSVSVLSDENGFIVLPSVKAGTDISIRVNRIRKDGPVPFRFWSYHANYPTCHIEVSPITAFIAYIPVSFGTPSIPASVFFRSVAPKGSKGLVISTHGDEVSSVEVMDSPKKTNGLVQKTGEEFSWMEETVFFVYTPKLTDAKHVFVDISVLWTETLKGPPRPITNGGTSTGEIPTSALNASTHPGKNDSGAGMDVKPGRGIGHSILRFLLVLFFACLAYFVIMSIVNYRVKGATEFPDMIPHIDSIRGCFQYVSLIKRSIWRGSGRGNYHDLNREEVSTDNF